MEHHEHELQTTQGSHSPAERPAGEHTQLATATSLLSRLGLALSYLPPGMPVDDLVANLESGDWHVRVAAVKQLGKLGGQTCVEAVRTALDDEEAPVRAAAVKALGICRDQLSVKGIANLMAEDHDWYVRESAVRALGNLIELHSLQYLLPALDDKDASVRAAAVHTLSLFGEQAPVERLLATLKDGAWIVREATVLALGRIGERIPIEPLLAALHDTEWQVRESARLVLEQLHPEALLSSLTVPDTSLEEPLARNGHGLGEQLQAFSLEEGTTFEKGILQNSKTYQYEDNLSERTRTTMEIQVEPLPSPRENIPFRPVPIRPAPRLKRFQTFIQSIAAVLVVGIILGGFLMLFSSRHPNTGSAGSNYRWCIVPNSNPGASLVGVAAISPTDVWAVGSNNQGKTLTEHWNGKKWQVVASPNVGKQQNIQNILSAVVAVSTDDVWAVGEVFGHMRGTTLVEHWDGKQWSIVSSPNRHPESYNNRLVSVAAISATDIWATGESDNYSLKAPDNNRSVETLIEHWDGKRWSIIASPDPGRVGSFLDGVAAFSAADVWAVGEPVASGGPLIEHWNGKQWSIVQSPKLKTNYAGLRAIAVLSADNIWAVGFESGGDTLIERWNGTRWNIVPSPAPGKNMVNILDAVSATSANDIWAAGSSETSNKSYTLIEHWDGKQWNIVDSPHLKTTMNSLGGVAATSAEHVWTAGVSSNGGRGRSPLIETLCGS